MRRVLFMARGAADRGQERRISELTQDEQATAALFRREMSHAEIPEDRGVVPATVRSAIHGIQRKLGLSWQDR